MSFENTIDEHYTESPNIRKSKGKTIFYITLSAVVFSFFEEINESIILQLISFVLFTILFIYLNISLRQFPSIYDNIDNAIKNEENDSHESILQNNSIQIENKIHSVVNNWIGHQDKPYTKNGITLKEVADMMNISQKDLSFYIRNHLQLNFFSWINSLRIEQCKNLIQQGKLNFTEIAYDCGFADLASMSKVFKKQCGTSPRGYKSNL